ncbi:MAG TPA: nucleoside triphosphate pyrophosphohydrolase [Nannocystaceae bacterium]|nr:nucleoside triphosphate pyrophosphohydrolase [Nannocystaceae bacterium]
MTVARDGVGENGGRAAEVASGSEADAASVPRHRALGLRDSLPGLRDLMDRLLGEGGCPWDREQTLESLRPYLLEEAHEVLEAMGDPQRHRKELGDLLFQIVFHAALREREGAFDLEDVIAAIRDKMIERHPHVFGPEPESLSSDEVARRWEARKRAKASEHDLGSLGVPAALPSLLRAFRLQDKAAALGFDWPDVGGALAKLEEELEELAQARSRADPAAMHDELGDVLFVLVRLATKLGLDADAALAHANAKFERRFGHVLRVLAERGEDPQAVGLAGLDALWDDAKRAERSGAT